MPFRVRVITSPACAPVTLPVTISAWPCSAILTMSSPATMLKVICGTVVSTSTDAPALAGLPALSDTVAVTAALPSAIPARSAAGTSSVQLPFACTWAVY